MLCLQRGDRSGQISACGRPQSYLIDVNAAMPCLIAAIERLGSQITSVTMDADTKNKLLSASAALRSVMTRLDALDKQSGNSDGLNRFITLFRDKSSLATISALTFGARNDDKDLRLNSVLLLGNVIDNRSVCVPLTHLNDPDFMKATEAVKARANLLGVVSVVAPWAYRENFNSIQKTHDWIRESDPAGMILDSRRRCQFSTTSSSDWQPRSPIPTRITH